MKPNISYGFGALTPTTWREIYTTVQAVSNGTSGQRVDQSVTREFIFARITNSTPGAVTITQWTYEWTQVLRTTGQYLWNTQLLTSATPGYGPAFNLLEANNTNAQVYGGINVTTGRQLVASPGFYYDPVPTNTVVLLRLSRSQQNAMIADFSAPNPITGACPTGLTTYYDGGTY
jgi:hypothetical protein